MFGILLAFASSLFRETGTSIGKSQALEKKESVHTMAFLNLFWAAIFFFAYAFFIRGEFLFDLASLPTFILRAALEILQLHFTMRAIVIADRSTFGFLRIWTIPLLLVVDITLGYAISFEQILGISLIVISFIILFINHGIKKKGAGFVLFTAINAVATISLFKYHITYFNSAEAEQGIITLILIAYSFIMARYVAKENPLRFLTKRIFFFQSMAWGIGSVLMSFAYLFGPASIITAAKRALTILTSTLAGNFYFHEKKLIIKLISFTLIALGIILLGIQ